VGKSKIQSLLQKKIPNSEKFLFSNIFSDFFKIFFLIPSYEHFYVFREKNIFRKLCSWLKTQFCQIGIFFGKKLFWIFDLPITQLGIRGTRSLGESKKTQWLRCQKPWPPHRQNARMPPIFAIGRFQRFLFVWLIAGDTWSLYRRFWSQKFLRSLKI